MKIKPISTLIYAFFGAVFLAGGAAVMLLHTGLLPGAITNILVEVAHGDPNTMHIMQDLGSLLVFAGLISFWFVGHYKQSKTFHWAMTTFWALFAIAHWYGASGFTQYVRPATINTIPFILFLAIGFLRNKFERE
jgi:hypothetical protein